LFNINIARHGYDTVCKVSNVRRAADKLSKNSLPNDIKIKIIANTKIKWASTPRRRNACLRHHSIRSIWSWPWPLTFDLENLFSDARSYDKYTYLWPRMTRIRQFEIQN